MEKSNTTSDFILLGLFKHTGLHLFLFTVVLAIAISSLVGNALMILLIQQDLRLHTPMYFLLSQLSLMDIMLVSTTVPKMAADYLTGIKSISTAGCGLQIFFLPTLGGGECFLLAAMSYDRYVAVCHPLRYPMLMSWPLCLRMTVGSWFLGANVMYICCVLMLLVPFCLILTSYSLILAAVLHMRSTEARKKAFATCSSHVAVVGLFYGAAIFIYMRPKSYRSAHHDKVVSAFYSIFTPMLNPLIYSLRNSEVKGSLKMWLGKCENIKHHQTWSFCSR
uniref:Olfactory receptor 2T33-like n=1 Tax=Ictidomys tridecemlineatus TaxID=43179 RepID=I3N8P4_ICTTR